MYYSFYEANVDSRGNMERVLTQYTQKRNRRSLPGEWYFTRRHTALRDEQRKCRMMWGDEAGKQYMWWSRVTIVRHIWVTERIHSDVRFKQKSIYRKSDRDWGSQELTSKATVHAVRVENGARLGDEATGSYSTHVTASRSFIVQIFSRVPKGKKSGCDSFLLLVFTVAPSFLLWVFLLTRASKIL